MYVVVVGNPFDGMTVYGPFDDSDYAVNWAETNFDQWLIVDLENPKTYE